MPSPRDKYNSRCVGVLGGVVRPETKGLGIGEEVEIKKR